MYVKDKLTLSIMAGVVKKTENEKKNQKREWLQKTRV